MKKLALLTFVLVLMVSSIAFVKPDLHRLVIQNKSDDPVSVILGEQYSFYVVEGKTEVYTIVAGAYDVTYYWCDEVVTVEDYDMSRNNKLTFTKCDVPRPLGEPGFYKVTLPFPE